MTATGALLLVPNTLDLGAEAVDLQDLLPLGVLRRAAALTHWAAEDARSARAFLKRVNTVVPLALPLQQIEIRELPRPRKGSHEAVPAAEWKALLAPALAGLELGVISEAGLPGVADPGAQLVEAAHAAGLRVQALAGSSSITLAIAAAGLNGQSFAFEGYLPQEAGLRAVRIRELEGLSRRRRQTQLVIEAPYRNGALFEALVTTLSPTTRLALSCGLTLPGGWSRTLAVAQWRQTPAPVLDRVPTVFGFLAV